MRSPEEIEALEAAEEKEMQRADKLKGPQVTVTSIDSPTSSSEEKGQNNPSRSAPAYVNQVDRWWVTELSAWVIAVASFIGIVILLGVWNNKQIPNWVIKSPLVGGKQLKTSLTINSIISLFGTVFKSTIMIPVAASIAQMKWLWFHDGNKLSDMQLFDAANRGPLGSVMLIWRMKGRQIVCLGSVVVILMLGIDFSFQSVVTYPLRSVSVASSVVPVVNTYSAVTFQPYPANPDIRLPVADERMSSVMRASMYNVDAAYPVTPVCSTGNCTFDHLYATLGVCSECLDATDALNVTCGTSDFAPSASGSAVTYCNYTWPGTEHLDYITSFNAISGLWYKPSYNDLLRYNLMVSTEMLYNQKFKTGAAPFTVLSLLYANWDTNNNLSSVRAAQCALRPCVQKYNASIRLNQFSEKLVGTFQNDSAPINSDPDVVSSGDFFISPPESFFQGINSAAPRQFLLSTDPANAIATIFRNTWIGQVSTGVLNHTSSNTEAIQTLYDLDLPGLSHMMTSLAGNMTNAMRMSNANSTNATNPNISGNTLALRPFVNVRWWWLTLPVLELVLVLVFLAMTMTKASKHQSMLWKGSGLAPFYYPLTKEGRSKVEAAVGTRQMEKVAGSLTVRWMETDSGMRLVQQDNDSAARKR